MHHAAQNLGVPPGPVYLSGESLTCAHPEMANLPDIGVVRKILSLEYRPYACGNNFCTP
jgi:hypothetical protein